MGFADWAEKQQAAAKAAEVTLAERKQTKVTDRFEGVALSPSTITYGKTSGPTRGATARVEQGADIQRRTSLARFAATGLFALRHKKITGHVFLTIEGDGYDIAVEVPAKKEADARTFAAKVNTAAKR